MPQKAWPRTKNYKKNNVMNIIKTMKDISIPDSRNTFDDLGSNSDYLVINMRGRYGAAKLDQI